MHTNVLHAQFIVTFLLELYLLQRKHVLAIISIKTPTSLTLVLKYSNILYVCRMAYSGMLRRVALVRTDVSKEFSASIIRVTRIGELGTIAVTSSVRRFLLTAKFRSLPIVVAMKMEALRSSETSVLTRATWRTSQKTTFFIVRVVETSNLTEICLKRHVWLPSARMIMFTEWCRGHLDEARICKQAKGFLVSYGKEWLLITSTSARESIISVTNLLESAPSQYFF
jgi:hypothetical protein